MEVLIVFLKSTDLGLENSLKSNSFYSIFIIKKKKKLNSQIARLKLMNLSANFARMIDLGNKRKLLDGGEVRIG